MVFKVKTSSPKTFTVSPTTGIINPQSTALLKISLVNSDDSLQKAHKFLIQAVPSTDINKTNWASPSVEEHKISARIISDPSPLREESKNSRESVYSDVISPASEVRNSSFNRNTFTIPETLREESSSDSYRKTAPVAELSGEYYGSPDRNKKILTARSSELAGIIENLKLEVEKANAKVHFSRELEVLTKESVGKYSIWHLVAAFLLFFTIGHYILG